MRRDAEDETKRVAGPVTIENGTIDQFNVGGWCGRKEVYQGAIDLAEKITRLTEAFPPRRHRHLASQLGRASLSISLNIAEGNGRWHVKE